MALNESVAVIYEDSSSADEKDTDPVHAGLSPILEDDEGAASPNVQDGMDVYAERMDGQATRELPIFLFQPLEFPNYFGVGYPPQ